MSKEAMKLALEALKQIDEAMPFPVAKLAQAALREALAEQPAQRTWQGLTESEKSVALYDKEGMTLDYEDYAEAIEAKLRSKNEDRN